MVQHDVVSPRPYSRINGLVGTSGAFSDSPIAWPWTRKGAHEWISGPELEPNLVQV